MRVLVCGGRGYTDRGHVFAVLDAQHADKPITDLIHGGAPGVDGIADQWAYRRRVRRLSFPANWKKHGPAAGPLRNQRMIDEGRPDLVIAFPGGPGTLDMLRRARKAGIKLEIKQ